MAVTNVAELNELVARVKKAQREYANFTQEQVDKIFRAAALAAALLQPAAAEDRRRGLAGDDDSTITAARREPEIVQAARGAWHASESLLSQGGEMAGVAVASDAGSRESALLGHVVMPGRAGWAALALLGAGAAALFYGFAQQVIHGHAVTGQGSHGAIWGIVVANIVNFIGISHVGIAISAVVRILRLERYRQLARLAEFVTLASITVAVMNIAMDVGRPERFLFNVVWYGRYHAPFVWSCTVITTYVVGSSVYLYLAMRRDLYLSSIAAPSRRSFFRVLALGYRDTPAARARPGRPIAASWCRSGDRSGAVAGREQTTRAESGRRRDGPAAPAPASAPGARRARRRRSGRAR